MKALNKFWEAWKRFGQMIGDLFARIVLTILYFTVVLPFGLGARLQGGSLQLKPENDETNWTSRETTDLTLDDARKQY